MIAEDREREETRLISILSITLKLKKRPHAFSIESQTILLFYSLESIARCGRCTTCSAWLRLVRSPHMWNSVGLTNVFQMTACCSLWISLSYSQHSLLNVNAFTWYSIRIAVLDYYYRWFDSHVNATLFAYWLQCLCHYNCNGDENVINANIGFTWTHELMLKSCKWIIFTFEL